MNVKLHISTRRFHLYTPFISIVILISRFVFCLVYYTKQIRCFRSELLILEMWWWYSWSSSSFWFIIKFWLLATFCVPVDSFSFLKQSFPFFRQCMTKICSYFRRMQKNLKLKLKGAKQVLIWIFSVTAMNNTFFGSFYWLEPSFFSTHLHSNQIISHGDIISQIVSSFNCTGFNFVLKI